MSRIRRVCLAASAVAALAFAIPTSASAISINSTSGNGTYNVTGTMTFYSMVAPSSGSMVGVGCWERDNQTFRRYGKGHAWGIESTAFQPNFLEQSPVFSGGCYTQDSGVSGGYGDVEVRMQGALMLTLTGLAPGENPSATRRAYSGRLWLHSYSSISFHMTDYYNCTVTIAGPQSVDLTMDDPSTGRGEIIVDDVKDEIEVRVLWVELASTKTAGCPSAIGNTVKISQPYYPNGWKLNGVTVTP